VHEYHQVVLLPCFRFGLCDWLCTRYKAWWYFPSRSLHTCYFPSGNQSTRHTL